MILLYLFLEPSQTHSSQGNTRGQNDINSQISAAHREGNPKRARMLEKMKKALDEQENSQFKPKDFTRQRNEMEFHQRSERKFSLK